MFSYFAYGSVLSLDHAREWCESHALDVKPFLAGVPARLDGYRLVFDVPSRFWAGLVADLQPDPNSHVEGVLFSIDERDRIAVQRKEGVATGLYREIAVQVLADGKLQPASAFLAVDDKRVPPGPASTRYVESLIAGSHERGLSTEWQRTLASVPKDHGKPPPPGVSLGMKKS